MRLPAPQVAMVTPNGQKAGSDTSNTNPATGISTLTISVFADRETGMIESLGVGEAQVNGIDALRNKLFDVFADAGNPFDQVIIQVSDNCRYDEVMKVMEVCAQQTLPNGERLSKLALVELPNG
jgi:hypothetical protein